MSINYRPKEIIGLENEIEVESSAARTSASIKGVIDRERILKIEKMRSRLEALYFEWAHGELT